MKLFQLFYEGKYHNTMTLWRFINLELWLRIFFDDHNKIKENNNIKIGSPNNGKKVNIIVNNKLFKRYPIVTPLIKKNDDYKKIIIQSLIKVNPLIIPKQPWFLAISEKIISIAQGRSYFIWDIKTGFWAKFLSIFVKKTPYGIGLGSPWTMQLAINEVGLIKILFASFISVLGKLFNISGLFYHIVGPTVRSIDGPTEYSLYPSNISAKLGPKDPEKVAYEIKEAILSNINIKKDGFQGVVITDANDLGIDILGNSTKISNLIIRKTLMDNPFGQTDEQTPLVLVLLSKKR